MSTNNNNSSTTSSTLNGDEQVSVGQTTTLAGVVTLSFLGIPPNLLSILLILRAKQPKSTTTYFLLNLAIADILNLLASLLKVILDFLSIQGGEVPWEIILTLKAVANVTLALIALERYNGLVKTMAPFVNIGKGKVKIILGLIWSVCIAFYMAAFIYQKMNNGGTKTYQIIYCTFSAVVIYILPLVVVGYCYGKILKGLSHKGGTILAQNPANETAMEEKKRFIRIMVVVAVVFIACNLPVIFVKLAATAGREVSMSSGLKNKLKLLGCVSSAVNPYIYGLHSEKYRKQVKELLGCKHSETTSPPA